MIKRISHIVASLCLITLLLLNSTAHEFIHVFTDHIDTTDCHHSFKQGEKSFEQGHIHCDFLDFAFSPYYFNFSDFSVPEIKQSNSFYSELLFYFTASERPHTSLRGPPMA